MKARVQSVDALRGLIMIVMALDHTRDFFHIDAPLFQPDNLARTTTALFFTRWITHFCAPVFMFTAGVGAFFWLQRSGRTKAQLSTFLITRGLWLALLDLCAVHFLVAPGSPVIILTPLWGLGWAMVVLAALIYIPAVPLAMLSGAVIASHNLLDKVQLASPIWNCLHLLGVFKLAGLSILITYPLIPWFAVMSAGYCFGSIVTRRRLVFCIGLALTIAFLVVRAINIYGDPAPWSAGLLSFLRCNKYPPSLDFLLMTLGPALLLLSWLDRFAFKPWNPLLVFGRVPLFFFVGHLCLLYFVAHSRYNLPVVYLIWASIIAVFYPLCRWFGRLKQDSSSNWVTYL